MRPRLMKLENARFDKLLVLEQADPPTKEAEKRGGTWWLCRCDCGQEEIIRGTDLQGKRRRQCKKCTQAERDLTGTEHGTWKVIRRAEPDELPERKYTKKQSWWLVQCVLCGKTDINSRDNIRKLHRQCTCIGRKKQKRPFVRTELDNRVKDAAPRNRFACCRCGKKFETAWGGEWGWNIGPDKYCSYTCMRAAEKERRPKRRKYG